MSEEAPSPPFRLGLAGWLSRAGFLLAAYLAPVQLIMSFAAADPSRSAAEQIARAVGNAFWPWLAGLIFYLVRVRKRRATLEDAVYAVLVMSVLAVGVALQRRP